MAWLVAKVLGRLRLADRYVAWITYRRRRDWTRRRDQHLELRLAIAPVAHRENKILATPYVYCECWCPCGCLAAFNYRTEPDVEWPTRCLLCRLIEQHRGRLTAYPELGYTPWFDSPRPAPEGSAKGSSPQQY